MKNHNYNIKLKDLARKNRKNPTKSEDVLWYKVLRNKQLDGFKFTRQKPMLNYILDFYCAKLQLAIEIDGDTHDYNNKHDLKRDSDLEKIGIKTIRYTDYEILNELDWIEQDLFRIIQKIIHNPL